MIPTMRILLTFVLVAINHLLFAQNVNLHWAQVFNNSSSSNRIVATIDSMGNTYTIGAISSGTIQKRDPNGNEIWTKTIGGNAGTSIAIDPLGNIIAAGSFIGSPDFDPGTGTHTLTSNGLYDAFVLKLDSDGNFLWVKQFGAANWDQIESIAVDDNGDIYTTGRFVFTVDFDPGPGVYNLDASNGTTNNSSDIFVQKLDANGDFLWAHDFGANNYDRGNAVAIDANGDVYFAGYFLATVDFDPGPGVESFNGSQGDGYLLKLTPNGEFIWVKTIRGSSSQNINAIVLDTAGMIYLAGNCSSSFTDFDPGPATYNPPSFGNSDAFVEKLDSLGNFVWAHRFGGPGYDYANAIDIDADGNVYTTGKFTDSMDIDVSANVLNLYSNGGDDVFIQKLSNNGDYLWSTQIGGSENDIGQGILIDQQNSIYTTGKFRDTADFDPTSGVYNLIVTSGIDGFIQKLRQCYPNSGIDTVTACESFTWIDGITYTSSTNTPTHILTNIGGCDSTVTLNLTILQPTTGTDTQTVCDSLIWIDGNTYYADNDTSTFTIVGGASNGCDSIVTLDLTVNYSTTGTDIVVACDSFTWMDGNTYTASNNTATHTLMNAVGCDSIVTLDLTINYSTTGIDLVSACDSFTWINGVTYTTSNNTAMDTLVNAAGCDSIVTLDLTINYSSTGTDLVTTCDSLTWIDGITYTASNNTATHTIINAAGCDSAVTLNLTIIHSSTGTDVVTACDSYTWIDGNTYTSSNNTATHALTNSVGCDSIITLDLTINYSTTGIDTHVACDSFTWVDGNTYTSSNNSATYTYTNAAGCDSIVTLNLTINSINTTVTVSGDNLTAEESGANYTWLKCPEMTPISGATNQSYTAIENGEYAVIIENNGCIDTSACYAITQVGIAENQIDGEMNVYPNPTDGMFSIDLGTTHPVVTTILTDVQGNIIQTKEHVNEQQIQIKLDGASGIYFLTIESPEKKVTIKIRKE